MSMIYDDATSIMKLVEDLSAEFVAPVFISFLLTKSFQSLVYLRILRLAGAWVFILSTVLVLLLLGGIGFFIYKKKSS